MMFIIKSSSFFMQNNMIIRNGFRKYIVTCDIRFSFNKIYFGL